MMNHPLPFLFYSAVAALALGVSSTSAPAASPGEPVHLECEYLHEPLGIDTPGPRLGWVVSDSDRGELQTAYRILVASNQANAEKNLGDMWDTAKVKSDEQSGLAYGGAPLKPRTRYWWKVMTYDKDGNASPWSATASFHTGFFGATGWPATAQFCSASGFIRKQFHLPEASPVAEAQLYLASGGGKNADIYVYLNGSQVAPEEFRNPGQMAGQDLQYRSLDVQPLLKAGDNILALLQNVGSLAVFLEVKFSDGSNFTMNSDGTWKAAKFTSVLKTGKNKEDYDARNDIEGWKDYGFDDSGWASLGKGGPIKKSLQSLAVPMTVHTTFTPVQISEPKPGVWVVDFGQNMTGIPVFKINNAEAGHQISYQPNESINPDGTVKIQGCDQLCTYICKGGAEEVVRPYFAYQGFRYLEITGYPGTLTADKVKALAACSDVLSANKFECSNDLINRIHRLASWGMRNNLISIPTDCPTRERTGWMGDAWFCATGELKLFRLHKFFDHFERLIRLNQDDDGALPYSVPFGGSGGSRFTKTCPVWGAANIMIPWYDYLEYGDKSTLAANYELNKRWVDFLLSRAVNYHLVNHATWGDRNTSGGGSPSEEFMKDAVFFRAADILSRIAAELGKKDDASKYADLAANIKKAICDAYLKVDAASKLSYFDNKSQGSQAIALSYGLAVDEKTRGVLAKVLTDDITKRSDHLGTGSVSTEALPSALASIGRNDKMWAITNQPTPPGWGGWVTKMDATTAFEGWGGGGSRDHPWLAGSVIQWFYEELAGVAPTKPGYKEIRFRPFIPAGLKSALAEINTVRGTAKSSWEVSSDNGEGLLKLHITVPVNAKAVAYVPTSNPTTVREGKGLAAAAAGITEAKPEKGYAVYSLGSGSYDFQSEFEPVPEK